ncbi:MAG: GNAT family N-acetyltransferase [Bacteroidetes bacterium]|nr:GNAT family N-acetyltransferase [Bacteroidota bacterium]
MNKTYLIQTERLGLRNWENRDLKPFAAMCADPEVMKHFPGTLTTAETQELINRLSTHYDEFGYTYFAVDLLETGTFIGFAGIKYQTWKSIYTPCVDIGWRLQRSSWGKGYATEAAKACLEAAFTTFNISEVLSFTPDTNTASEHVMKKIGMEYIGNVQHPAIENDPRFKHCVVYKSYKTEQS